MFKNYIKIAFRNMFKFKIFSTINVFSLAIGMAACLLMLMYVVNEISFENFHHNKNRIYRIATEWGQEESKMKFAGSMPALAPALNSQIPEVEKAIRIQRDYGAVIINQAKEEIQEDNLFFTDPAIFDIFSFNLVEGDKATALRDPFSVVLSEKQASKYFGSNSPIGEYLDYGDTPLKITGLMENVPINTHLNCEFLVSYSTLKALGKVFDKPWNHWGDDLTYVLLKQNVSPTSLLKKLDELLLTNTEEWYSSRMKFRIQNLSDIHWDTESRGDIGDKGNKMYIYIFLSAALFVLIIACFNFMNLSTSRYLDRVKEIGVRKVVGAQRGQLIKQFLVESFLVTTISIIFGIVLFEFLHSLLYSYLGSNAIQNIINFNYFYAIVAGIVLIVGFFAGGYPALFLSQFKPVEIMKRGSMKGVTKLSFRNILVVFQFAITIILIFGTTIIYQQLNYMKNSDLGFEKENVVLLNFPFTNKVAKQKYTVLRDELKKNHNIVDGTCAYTVPGINSRMNMSVRKKESSPDNSVSLQALPADFGYASSIGLKIIQGRDFSNSYSLEEQENVILNQTAVKVLDLKNPIGEKLKLPGNKDVTVIGVAQDFYIQSFHNKINPMLIYINREMFVLMALKIKPQNITESLTFIENTWKNVLPDVEFNHRYMEDAYNNLYQSEEKTGRLLTIFTVLALLISCLGLFGLASFMSNKRIKEIGIRKVLGASVSGIVFLLNKDLMKRVIFANIFAWPFAWFAMSKWLQYFAYQIEISWWMFLFAGVIALMIALLTVSYQAVTSAMANPVDNLRYE
jgi:putative ABC transport system permease protein